MTNCWHPAKTAAKYDGHYSQEGREFHKKRIDYQSVNETPLENLSIILDQSHTIILWCLDYWHICLFVRVYCLSLSLSLPSVGVVCECLAVFINVNILAAVWRHNSTMQSVPSLSLSRHSVMELWATATSCIYIDGQYKILLLGFFSSVFDKAVKFIQG